MKGQRAASSENSNNIISILRMLVYGPVLGFMQLMSLCFCLTLFRQGKAFTPLHGFNELDPSEAQR